MKIIEVTNVDFSLRQFLLPLMREIRARGHDVVGACAEGQFLMSRARRAFASWRCRSSGACRRRRIGGRSGFWSLFREEKPDLVHAHMPISGFLARMAAWWAGVPRIANTCHGFWFNYPGNPARQAVGWRWSGSPRGSPLRF